MSLCLIVELMNCKCQQVNYSLAERKNYSARSQFSARKALTRLHSKILLVTCRPSMRKFVMNANTTLMLANEFTKRQKYRYYVELKALKSHIYKIREPLTRTLACSYTHSNSCLQKHLFTFTYICKT